MYYEQKTITPEIAGEDTEKLKTFCDVLNTGFMQNPNQSAAIVLRKFLQERKHSYGAAGVNQAVVFAEMAIKDFLSETPRTNRYSHKGHVYIKSDIFNW